MASSYVTCRVLSGRGVQCTGEAVDPNAELKICTRHLAEALRLLQDARLLGGNVEKTRTS